MFFDGNTLRLEENGRDLVDDVLSAFFDRNFFHFNSYLLLVYKGLVDNE